MFSRRNRASYPGSYLQPLAAMYTRWRVRGQRYILIPSVGSTFAGQILMAQDPDPVSTYNDDTTAIQSLSVLVGGSTKQAWEQNSCFMPHTKEHDNLFTQDVDTTVEDYTERFSCAGNLFIACVAVGDMASATVTIGSIWLEYDYEFYEPRLQLNQLSDPSLIGITAPLAFITKLTAAVTGTVPGPGIMQELMAYINVIDLSVTTIQSLYDAVATFFSYLPYSFAITPADPLTSRYLKNGAGVSPLEHPGYGPGNYQLIFKMFMTSGLMNNIKNAWNAFYGPPTSSDPTGAQLSAWYVYINSGGATQYHDKGYMQPRAWFGAVPQFSGVNSGTVNSFYNGNYFTTTVSDVPTVIEVNILQDIGGSYNELDGKTYSGCWTWDVAFYVNSRRGYADLELSMADFGDTTLNNTIAAILAAAVATEDVVITMDFTNKASNVFTADDDTVKRADNLCTLATLAHDKKLALHKKKVLESKRDRVPDPIGPEVKRGNGEVTFEPPPMVDPRAIIERNAILAGKTSPYWSYANRTSISDEEFKTKAKEMLDNAYMVQRAMADSDDDDKDEGRDVSTTNATSLSIKERRLRQASAPGGRGIKLRSGLTPDPFPNGRDERRDPPPIDTPKGKSQSNK